MAIMNKIGDVKTSEIPSDYIHKIHTITILEKKIGIIQTKIKFVEDCIKEWNREKKAISKTISKTKHTNQIIAAQLKNRINELTKIIDKKQIEKEALYIKMQNLYLSKSNELNSDNLSTQRNINNIKEIILININKEHELIENQDIINNQYLRTINEINDIANQLVHIDTLEVRLHNQKDKLNDLSRHTSLLKEEWSFADKNRTQEEINEDLCIVLKQSNRVKQSIKNKTHSNIDQLKEQLEDLENHSKSLVRELEFARSPRKKQEVKEDIDIVIKQHRASLKESIELKKELKRLSKKRLENKLDILNEKLENLSNHYHQLDQELHQVRIYNTKLKIQYRTISQKLCSLRN